jgi:hypothetical protein
LKRKGVPLAVVFCLVSRPLQVFVFPFLFSGKYENCTGWNFIWRVSRKAWMTKRKSTGEILLP